MHVNFGSGRPSPSFTTRLRALCEEHNVDLVVHSSPAKRRCISVVYNYYDTYSVNFSDNWYQWWRWYWNF